MAAGAAWKGTKVARMKTAESTWGAGAGEGEGVGEGAGEAEAEAEAEAGG